MQERTVGNTESDVGKLFAISQVRGRLVEEEEITAWAIRSLSDSFRGDSNEEEQPQLEPTVLLQTKLSLHRRRTTKAQRKLSGVATHPLCVGTAAEFRLLPIAQSA